MTPADVARNARAVRNMAEQLESWGLDDAHRRAESLLVNALADGYRPIGKPDPEPAPTGRGSSEHARRQALVAAEQAIRAAREAIKYAPKEKRP